MIRCAISSRSPIWPPPLPIDAIVVDEAVTTGRGFDAALAAAAPHDWLTGCGGAIGFGLPAALGAAVAAPSAAWSASKAMAVACTRRKRFGPWRVRS